MYEYYMQYAGDEESANDDQHVGFAVLDRVDDDGSRVEWRSGAPIQMTTND
jgi:hypothetical protein